MAKKVEPLVCYVKAPTREEAQQAAWDLDYTSDNVVDAEASDPYPDNVGKARLYAVTITAEPVRSKRRHAKKGASRG
mgnify:CR=1 FL=1